METKTRIKLKEIDKTKTINQNENHTRKYCNVFTFPCPTSRWPQQVANEEITSLSTYIQCVSKNDTAVIQDLSKKDAIFAFPCFAR